MKYLNKFSGIAEIYDNYRPTYSYKFLDWLKAYMSVSDIHAIADIGAGTGILTELLAEIYPDANITAVEPNDSMFDVLTFKMKNRSNIILNKTTAENTCLESNSIDLITAAQAFHWFDVKEFKKECKRILKPEGKVCLVWNSRQEDNDLAQETIQLFKKYCKNYSGFCGGVCSGKKYADEFFKGYIYEEINAPTYFDLPMFIGRNLSMSYAPKIGEPEYKPFIEGLIDLFIKYNVDGILTIENNVVSYLGEID